MHMCVYVYIHTYIHTYIHIHVYIYIFRNSFHNVKVMLVILISKCWQAWQTQDVGRLPVFPEKPLPFVTPSDALWIYGEC